MRATPTAVGTSDRVPPPIARYPVDRPLPRPPAPPAHRHRRRLLASALTLVVALSACGGEDVGTDQATAEHVTPSAAGGWADGSDHETVEDLDVVDGSGPEGPTEDGEASLPPVVLAAAGRERVRNAWITLELEDPETAVAEVTAAVEERGGFVSVADLVRDTTTGQLDGTLTARVPSVELQPTLDTLEDLAVAAPVRRIEEEEVGAELTDLRAQETNLTAYEEELRELLAVVREGSSDPDDLLPVVSRLQSVRSDIDRLRARRLDLEDRVALSTITVTLTPTAASAPIAASAWAPARTFQGSLAATGRALGRVADAAIWIGVTGLPVTTVVAGPPLALWWWSRRRRGSARPAATPPPAA
jgi:hypothetical protein